MESFVVFNEQNKYQQPRDYHVELRAANSRTFRKYESIIIIVNITNFKHRFSLLYNYQNRYA